MGNLLLALLLAAISAAFPGCSAHKPAKPGKPAVVATPPSPPLLTEAEREKLEAAQAVEVEARAEALARFSAGLSAEMQGDQELATAEFLQAALANLDNTDLVLDVSLRLVQARQVPKAYDLVKQAAARPAAAAPLLAHFGWLAQQVGQPAEGRAAAQKAIKLAPDILAGHRTLFFLCVGEKQLPEAQTVLDQAAVQKGDAAYLIDLAELYLKLNELLPDQAPTNRARAVAVLDRARALKPEAIGYLLKQAELYNAFGETKKAVELYLDMQEKFAAIPTLRDSIRAKLTELYLRGRERKKAMEQLEAIIKEYPLNAQAYYYLGGLAFEEKEYAKAGEYLAKTILLNPNFEQGYYDTAAAYINADQPKEALATLAQARKKFPQSFILEYYTGLAHLRAKDHAAALKAFTTAEIIASATDTDKLTAGLYFQIGATCERLKRFDEAERYFQRALDQNPNFAEALNYLGYMWAERNINLDRAQAMLERALKLEPKNPAFLDSLGWVLYRQGKFERARELVQKAIELNPEPDATLHDHLGDICAALKQWDCARENWEKANKLEPNEDIAKKIRALPAKDGP